MSELFEKMEADANAFTSVEQEGGSELSSLIRASQDLQKNIEFLKQEQKEAQKEYDKIIRELIPAAMESMGLDRVDVDGNSVTLQPFVFCRISEEKKDECFAYLNSAGLGDVIKNEVKVTFGKGEDNLAGAFVDDCVKQGYSPDNKKTVHPSTLKAVIKDLMSKGSMSEQDLELFGAFTGTEAKIRRK